MNNVHRTIDRVREPGRTRKLAITYGMDWLMTIGLTAAFFLLANVHGFWREFDLTDTSIQHTFAVRERVPNWALGVISFVVPGILLPGINYATIRDGWDWHISSLGLVLSLGMTGTITNLIKICVGRPRPDLIDRCQPIPGSINHPVFGLTDASICTQTDMAILKDGFRSFPSGHSSLSFAGLGFVTWYLAGKLHLFDHRGYTGKPWLAVSPLVAAALVAVSRTMDYRHHYQDVFVGSVLGLVVSFFAYRQYYPPLSARNSHKPYSPRIPSEPKTTLPLYRGGAILENGTLLHGNTSPRYHVEALEPHWADEAGYPDDESDILGENSRAAPRPTPPAVLYRDD